MSNKANLPIPVQKALRKLGQDIKDARIRRRIPVALMIERAGLSRATLGRIETGDPSVSLGSYAATLFVLGLTERLGELADATHDLVGRRLEEEHLPKRIRLPSTRKNHE